MRSRRRQGGYFLLAITAALAVIAFGFVTAYSTLLAKKEQVSLLATQKTYLEHARLSLERVYDENAAAIDSDAGSSAWRSTDVFLQLASVSRRWGLQAQVSQRLMANGLAYSVIALWLPTETDSTNPPVFDPNTGQFTSCSNPSAPCDPRAYVLVSGLGLQQKRQDQAIKQLNDLAAVHQSFFKAQQLQDPEHDLSKNYFRAPDGNCANTYNMPCIDTYTPENQTSVPGLLSLSSDSLVNPWGLPVEVSNLQDSSQVIPYTMSLKSQTPWGTTYTILAVEPV